MTRRTEYMQKPTSIRLRQDQMDAIPADAVAATIRQALDLFLALGGKEGVANISFAGAVSQTQPAFIQALVQAAIYSETGNPKRQQEALRYMQHADRIISPELPLEVEP